MNFTELTNTILKFYANKYFLGPIGFTLIFAIILFAPYSANGNFDLVTTFFGYLVTASAFLLAVFLHNIISGKKDFTSLFAIAFISLMLSIMAVLFFKTVSFFSYFSVVTAILAAFAFFTMFKEIIAKIQ